jgi:predicted O-methyltransferase YrrM
MELKNVTGHISDANIETLQKYVKLLAEDRDQVVIVDIGTCAGKSACAMALASPKALVYTCDPIYHIEQNDTFYKVGVLGQVIYYPVGSIEFARDWCPQELDMVFIDGLHGYSPGVRDDLDMIGKRVKKGGYICMHDKNLYDGIAMAIVEQQGKMYEFVEEGDSGETPESGRQGTVYVGRRI